MSLELKVLADPVYVAILDPNDNETELGPLPNIEAEIPATYVNL